MLDRRRFLTGLVALSAAACASNERASLAPSTGEASGDTTSGAKATGTSSTATSSTAAPTSLATTTTAAPTTTVAPTTTFNGTARYINQGNASAKRIALTFHTEGTVAQVTKLLDMAKALDVPLTLLMVGKWAEANPTLCKRAADAGHDIGNHTYSHLSLPDQNRTVTAQEIRTCADVLRNVTGSPGRWFRPSGSNSTTALINEEAGKAGYPIVLGFDMDPLDYQDPGGTAVRTRVVNALVAGGLVSLHAQHQDTLDVFESLVGAVRDKGYALVRASDLVS